MLTPTRLEEEAYYCFEQNKPVLEKTEVAQIIHLF